MNKVAQSSDIGGSPDTKLRTKVKSLLSHTARHGQFDHKALTRDLDELRTLVQEDESILRK